MLILNLLLINKLDIILSSLKNWHKGNAFFLIHNRFNLQILLFLPVFSRITFFLYFLSQQVV